MISKKKYLPFRVEDLTGGINVKDYASEIEDKQSVSIKNWNFEGNKLISEKGYTDSLIPSHSEIGALKLDSNDIWTVSQGAIQKNGVGIDTGSGLIITINDNKNIYESTDQYGNLQKEEYLFYPRGVQYYIEIDSVEYFAEGVSKAEIITDLSTKLQSAGYLVIENANNLVVYKADGSNVSYSIPGYKTYIIYNNTNIVSSSDYNPGEYFVIPVKVDGTMFVALDRINTGEDAGDVDVNGMKALKTKLEAGGYDCSIEYLNSDEEIVISDTIPSGGSAGLVINKVTTIETFSDHPFQASGQKVYMIFFKDDLDNIETVTIDGNNINMANVYDGGNSQWVEANNLKDEIIAIGAGWNAEAYYHSYNGNSQPAVFFWKDDFTDISYSVSDPNDNLAQYATYGINGDNFQLGINVIGVDETAGTVGLDGRANITVGNLGELIVDKDEGGAYYASEGLIVTLKEDAVGLPTVGTIYNGKIVLGGYSDNDNIIFSQTSSPSQPFNLINFEDYSAGGQSISGGDKGLVTGMVVGENGLYVFKDNSVWYSNSEKDDPSSNSFNFIFRKITSNGALTQNVITEVDQEIFYLDWKNRAVRRLGYEQNLTTLRDTSISREINNLFDELPENQPLATAHFNYPYYQLSLSDGLSSQVEYNNGNTYHSNNKHFIYNVENKSWTTRDGVDEMIVSDKGYFAKTDGKVYKDFEGNTTQDGETLSKEYTFGDDIMYKKYGRFEVIGKIIPESGSEKTLTVEIWIDGEMIDSREYTRDTVSQIREKIDLFDIGQQVQFKLKHSGSGKVEVYDVQVYYKGTNIQPQDFH